MFLRQGNIRVHHFYHKSKTCSFESALHNAFKLKLFQRIEAGLRQNRESCEHKAKLMIQWYCANCQIKHQGDLLKRIADAKLEVKVDAYTPDISLYRQDGSVYSVIEIEYTHQLEDEPRQYYNENNIWIIVFMPITIGDLRAAEDDPLVPFSSNICQYKIEDEKPKNRVTENSPPGNTAYKIIGQQNEALETNLIAAENKGNVGIISLTARFLSSLIRRISRIFHSNRTSSSLM